MPNLPPSYLVKELQRTVAFIQLNHLHKSGKLTFPQQYELFFNTFHGNLSIPDPSKVPFVDQLVTSQSLFSSLYVADQDTGPGQSRLTGSPSSPVRFRLNPLLLPGAEKAFYVGIGPSADFKKAHLELSCLNGKTKALIMGRTLHRLGNNMHTLLKKVEPLIQDLLNADGSIPSGETKESLLRKLADKIAVMLSSGQLNLNVEDDEVTCDSPPTVASLTQGAQVQRQEAQANARSQWTYKLIPCAGWFCVALFCSIGIARAECQTKLPLLMTGDYSKEEKKKHSRASFRKGEKEAAARDRSFRNPVKPTITRTEQLLGSVVGLLASAHEVRDIQNSIKEKNRVIRAVEKNITHLEWRMDYALRRGYNVDPLEAKHTLLLEQLHLLQEELEKDMDERSMKRESENDVLQTARKIARTVDVSVEGDSVVVPSVIGVEASIVSEFDTGTLASVPTSFVTQKPSPKQLSDDLAVADTAEKEEEVLDTGN